MTKTIEYLKQDNFTIVGITDEGKLIAFGVADNQLEKVTSETFETASLAVDWGNENYKGLVC